MEYLTTEDILRIHSATIDETGGSHGVREHGALATLEALPKQGAFGSELYATVFDKAAVYLLTETNALRWQPRMFFYSSMATASPLQKEASSPSLFLLLKIKCP